MSNSQKDEPPGTPARTTQLTDPRALRAYAHPTRMRLVGLLRTEGPFTATRAAELTGESVASCSYHLRMLAKYGLVEVAPGGHGREKPWRATARFTQWPNYSEDPAVAEASRALETAVAERYFELITRAIEERHDLPREWQEAEHIGDQVLYLTAEELADLGEKLDRLLRPYEDRQGDPAARPQDARLVQIVRAAFPLPQQPAGNEETSIAPDSTGGPR
nr:helix-turn-helix domain-containing protein [Streptomyces canus]